MDACDHQVVPVDTMDKIYFIRYFSTILDPEEYEHLKEFLSPSDIQLE